MRTRPRLSTLAALALVAAALSSAAPAQQENTEYRTLGTPQPTASPGKIEVIEFFSYGCPHCAEFYPLVSSWQTGLAKDVVFRRVPVGFGRPAWVNLQRAFYALQASGDFPKLDAALFQAIHEERQQLFDQGALTEWVGRMGGHADAFTSAYGSFGINSQTVQADKLAEDYEVTGVPTMAVDGRFLAQGSNFSELLANTDKLIAKVRAEHAAAAKKK